MSLLTTYSDPRGIYEPAVTVSLGSNIRFAELGLAMAAAAGDSGTSSIEIEDPGGIYDFVGLRAFTASETSAPSNNQVIGRFVMQDREVGRSVERALLTGTDRLWTVDLTDFNWHLGKRILVDSDANRPAESAGARILWLLTHAAHIDLYDFGHVTYPSRLLEAQDYRGMRPSELLVDCAIEDQFNFWAAYNEAHQKPELFFFDPDTTTYTSDLVISNRTSEVIDQTTILPPSRDAKLRRSPSRLAFGCYLPYVNGYVYQRNDIIKQQFAAIDQAAPMATVKSEARATRLANVFLARNDEEQDVISFAYDVDASRVNDLREGQRFAGRFIHLPGYEGGRWLRAIRRVVQQHEVAGGAKYRVEIEAVPTGDDRPDVFAPAPVATAGAILYQPGNDGGTPAATAFDIEWGSTGDNPGTGYGARPRDAAAFDYIDSVPEVMGFEVLAISGTLDLYLQISVSDAVGSPRTYTMHLKKNGVDIDTDAFTQGPGFVGGFLIISYDNLAVVQGDLLTVTLTTSALAGCVVPWGSGDLSNRFEIKTTSTVVLP